MAPWRMATGIRAVSRRTSYRGCRKSVRVAAGCRRLSPLRKGFRRPPGNPHPYRNSDGACAMTTLSRTLLLAAGLTFLASGVASSQTLAGTVRDTSGAILPGVTVEASSPALIEKARAAAADGNGQYQITNLPPGTYSITFTLPGFTTVVHEGVELTGSGVTSINAEMRV